jgi:hypothetical protein
MARATDHETQAQRFLRKSGGAWHFDDVEEGINCLADIREMPGGGYIYEFRDSSVVVERRGEYCIYASIRDLLVGMNRKTN